MVECTVFISSSKTKQKKNLSVLTKGPAASQDEGKKQYIFSPLFTASGKNSCSSPPGQKKKAVTMRCWRAEPALWSPCQEYPGRCGSALCDITNGQVSQRYVSENKQVPVAVHQQVTGLGVGPTHSGWDLKDENLDASCTRAEGQTGETGSRRFQRINAD